MATIKIRDSFKREFTSILSYALTEFGTTTLMRFNKEYGNIRYRLSKHPLSSPREPLLRNYPRSYRSAIIMGNWKIIYRYDETYNRVIFVDLWDMRMNPNRLVKQFKKKL